MKNILTKIYLLTILIFTSSVINAQAPGVGVFTSLESKNKVYYAALEALTAIKYSTKDTDKEAGIIQAEQYIISGQGKVINLFATIKEEEGKTVLKATFTKPWGVSGKMSEQANAYGLAIKKIISDLEIVIEETETASNNGSIADKAKSFGKNIGNKTKGSISKLKSKTDKSNNNELANGNSSSVDNCKPALINQNGDGDTMKYYGGYVRAPKLITDDESSYSLHIVQTANGTKGTFIVVSLREYFDEGKLEYNTAVNNYLNQTSLMNNSNLKLVINGEMMMFTPISCQHTPRRLKIARAVIGYDAVFMAGVSKAQIKTLQENELQDFQFNLGGKPYQTTFKKSKPVIQNIQKSIACVDLTTIYEVKQKEASEVDMTEVAKADYANTIVGKWSSNSNGTRMELTLSKDGKFVVSRMGMEVYKGTFKILSDRFIYTSPQNSGADKIVLFLQDMVILESNGKEETWTRVE